MTTILMTGARGNTGRLAGPLLAARGATVRGGSRDPRRVDLPGVTPVAFDWSDRATWAPALAGVDALYVQRPEVREAPELVGALVAAAPAGTRVVLLSDDVHGAEVPPGSWEGRVERAVTERAAHWTLLRPNWFQQVLSDERYFLAPIRDRGEIEIPTGGVAISFVDARDIADVAVAALLDDGHDGQIYDLTGPAAVTVAEVAGVLSAAVGHEVRHLDPPLRESVQRFAAGAGADPWYVEYIDHVWSVMATGAGAAVSGDVERVLGRPARAIEQFIAEHAARWRRPSGGSNGRAASATVRRWSITEFRSDLGGIELLDVAHPGEPGPGEALVAVKASGLSISDLLLASGGMPGMAHELPYPIGIEYAGVVAAVGPGEGVAAGDRVVGMVHDGATGSAGELLRVPAADLGRLPDGLSFAQGAAIPVAYMTAHLILHRQGRPRPGDKVLVTAAASGTGLALVQLARAAGAEVYGAVTGTAKLDAVRAAGAVAAFDLTAPDWTAGLPELDLVVDTLAGESLRRSYDLLAPGGRLVVLDATTRYPGPGETEYRSEPGDLRLDPVRDLMFDAKTVTGVFVPLLWPREGGPGRMLREALAHFEDPAIRPAIAGTYGFEDAVEGLRHLRERRNVGRVVLEV